MPELNLGHVVGPGVPTGGTSGQILKKNSATNFDTSWSNNDATTIPMSSSDSTSINQAISKNAVNRQDTVADCNDTSVGAGCFRIISSTANTPVSSMYGVLYNMFGKDYYTQIVIMTGYSRMFFRKYVGAWSNWVELALKSDVENITPGTSFTDLVNDSYAYTATDAKIVSFTIPKASVVVALQNYNGSSPKDLIISNSSTAIAIGNRLAEAGNINNAVVVNAVLPAGTYYLWGSAGSSGSNTTIVKYCPI